MFILLLTNCLSSIVIYCHHLLAIHALHLQQQKVFSDDLCIWVVVICVSRQEGIWAGSSLSRIISTSRALPLETSRIRDPSILFDSISFSGFLTVFRPLIISLNGRLFSFHEFLREEEVEEIDLKPVDCLETEEKACNGVYCLFPSL